MKISQLKQQFPLLNKQRTAGTLSNKFTSVLI